MGNYVSYGYKKCDTDKSQIEIDPVAAKHVRDIFTWKMEGMSNQLIADKLNELGVLAPADYKRATGVNFKSSFQTHLTSRWSAVAIIRTGYVKRKVRGWLIDIIHKASFSVHPKPCGNHK